MSRNPLVWSVARNLFQSGAKLAAWVAVLFVSLGAWPSDWQLIGPEGGDVRSLAYDPGNPSRVLLGTSSGQLFLSEDGGASWRPFAHLGQGDDYVLDHIIFDPTHPATIYVAGWSLFSNEEGDVFRSDDGGRSWHILAGVHGKSIRTMAMAPSDPNTLVIGALDGVFRSHDAGANWERISPENHPDLRNVESLAIDPRDPDVVYVGTWHLPWKTGDGGKNWSSIKQGVLDDSDVFSIIIDKSSPATVYASACSGIYKSENGGALFRRIKGIPHTAIRTRVLQQDPRHPAVVYAGTTGGLWKTTDGGSRWQLVSDASVIVNDVMIDPRDTNRVLAATDRGGILASSDGFSHYATSNRGFAHRLIGSVIVDRKDDSTLYAGVVNDKALGGFFSSEDGGHSWQQHNRGLDNRDILSLQQSQNGVIFAGTNHGILYLPSLNGSWLPATMVRRALPQGRESGQQWSPQWKKVRRGRYSTAVPKSKTLGKTAQAAQDIDIPLDQAPRVRALEMGSGVWYAATNEGLFTSTDNGEKWYGSSVQGENDFIAVTDFGKGTLTLVSPKRAFISTDHANSWKEITYPPYVTGLYDLTIAPDASMWLATREGALHSADGGATWEHVLAGLPARYVYSVRYDSPAQRLLATARNAHGVFESRDGGRSWQRSADSGVSIRSVLNFKGRLLAASSYNGLLLERVQDRTDARATEPGRNTGGDAQ